MSWLQAIVWMVVGIGALLYLMLLAAGAFAAMEILDRQKRRREKREKYVAVTDPGYVRTDDEETGA